MIRVVVATKTEPCVADIVRPGKQREGQPWANARTGTSPPPPAYPDTRGATMPSASRRGRS